MTFILAAFLGLYPLTMPAGQEQFAEQIAAQLHRGASTLLSVRAFDLIAHSACAPDETACLAGAARRAGLDAMLSAEVKATPDGYRWVLRDVAAGGKLLAERSGEVRGGPAALASVLEHGVRETVAAAHSTGWLRVHEGDHRSPVPSGEVISDHLQEPRVTPSRVVVGGIALLAAGGAIGLLSGSTARSGSTTGYAAAMLAATGAGAIVAGGLVFALSPNGFAVAGEF